MPTRAPLRSRIPHPVGSSRYRRSDERLYCPIHSIERYRIVNEYSRRSTTRVPERRTRRSQLSNALGNPDCDRSRRSASISIDRRSLSASAGNERISPINSVAKTMRPAPMSATVEIASCCRRSENNLPSPRAVDRRVRRSRSRPASSGTDPIDSGLRSAELSVRDQRDNYDYITST